VLHQSGPSETRRAWRANYFTFFEQFLPLTLRTALRLDQRTGREAAHFPEAKLPFLPKPRSGVVVAV
jgi:hypothetical protein